MARIRTIKPEFFTSLTIADLSLEARLTFIGLWTHVDDSGRCVDDARLVKAALWPLDDRVSADVERDLRELTESSLIVRYRVGDRSYIAIRSWREHQRINRPTPSKLPAPPERPVSAPKPAPEAPATPRRPAETAGQQPQDPHITDNSVSTHAQLTEDSPQERKGTGNREQGKEQGVIAPQAAPRTPQGTRLPDDFEPSPELIEWARTNAPTVGRTDHETFVDYWRGKPGAAGKKLDWSATWRNWMRREHERRAGAGRSQPANGNRPSTTDQRVAAGLALAAQLDAQYGTDTKELTA